MLLLLAACYFPTTYGLRDDGLLPTGPEVTAQASQAGIYAVSGPAPWLGAQGRFRLGPKVGLRLNAAGMPFPTSEGPQLALWNGEADVLFGLTAEPERAVTTTLSLGASALVFVSPDSGSVAAQPGLQAGLTVSRTVAETLHPYAGVRVNPVGSWFTKSGDLWLNGGAGLSWRPRLGPVDGVFGLEASGAYGLNACYDLVRTENDKLGLTRDGCASWTVGVTAGLTFGKG